MGAVLTSRELECRTIMNFEHVWLRGTERLLSPSLLSQTPRCAHSHMQVHTAQANKFFSFHSHSPEGRKCSNFPVSWPGVQRTTRATGAGRGRGYEPTPQWGPLLGPWVLLLTLRCQPTSNPIYCNSGQTAAIKGASPMGQASFMPALKGASASMSLISQRLKGRKSLPEFLLTPVPRVKPTDPWMGRSSW